MFFVVFTSICAGVISGSFGALRAENIQIFQHIEADKNQIIITSFLENMKYFTWIAVWGLNSVGVPVIIYLLYSKGAYISAAVYSIMALESANKFVAVISVIPYIACTVLGTVLLSQASLECSLSVCKTIVFNKQTGKGQKFVLKLAICFMLSLIAAFLGGLAETLLKVNIT